MTFEWSSPCKSCVGSFMESNFMAGTTAKATVSNAMGISMRISEGVSAKGIAALAYTACVTPSAKRSAGRKETARQTRSSKKASCCSFRAVAPHVA